MEKVTFSVGDIVWSITSEKLVKLKKSAHSFSGSFDLLADGFVFDPEGHGRHPSYSPGQRSKVRKLLTAAQAVAAGLCTQTDVDAMKPKKKVLYRNVIYNYANEKDPVVSTCMYKDEKSFTKEYGMAIFISWGKESVEIEEDA